MSCISCARGELSRNVECIVKAAIPLNIGAGYSTWNQTCSESNACCVLHVEQEQVCPGFEGQVCSPVLACK